MLQFAIFANAIQRDMERTESNCVTVKFVDFWPTFDVEHNKFVDALRSKYLVTVLPTDGDEVPDLLFYSRCGNGRHLSYDCIRIYFTGENDCPDFNECDYALSFYPLTLGDRHLRYPLYMLYEYDRLGTPETVSDSDALGRGFCSLLMRNATNCDPRRLEIIDCMELYRPLAYGGPFRNNAGGCVEEKIPFISRFKFNLALENSLVEGYVTEKILEPLVASTVPIYWGDDTVKKDFNPEAFINSGDYDTPESLTEAVRQIDNDPGAYLRMLRAPKLIKGHAPDFDGMLADFLCHIAATRRKYLVRYGEQNVLHRRARTVSMIRKSPLLMRVLGRLGNAR